MNQRPPSLIGRPWLVVAGIVVSVVALWFAVQGVDLAFVGNRLGQADLKYLVAVLVVGSVQLGLRTARWRFLLPRRSDGTRVRSRRLLPVLLIGYLGNVALPARLGEVVRTYLVSRREEIDPIEVFGTVVLERILDVVALAAFALVVATLIGAPGWIVGAAAIAAIVGAVALFLATAGLPQVMKFFAGRLEPGRTQPSWLDFPGLRGVVRLARRFAAGLGGRQRPTTVALAAGLSLAAWPLDALLIWLVAASIHIELSLPAAALISAAAVLSTAVPSAPGYVGTYELAAAFAAQAMGVPESPAFALAILAHAFTVLPAAIAGAVCLIALRGSFGAVLPSASGSPPPESSPS
jgi:glycosyltransferase 2 family protein